MVTWGNNTTTVFGTSTPASAAAAPGAPAPATGFSFGATPAAAPAAPSTPPVFSTPAPSIPPLNASGTGTSTGGATSFSFGAPSSAAPAPFGAPAPAPSSGGLFGATPAPSTGGLFGATPAPSTGGSLFGASSTTPAPSTSLFGAPAAPAAPASSGFGSSLFSQPAAAPAAPATPFAQQAPHQAAYAAHQSAAQRQETARIEEAIFSLHSKYSPNAADPLNPALATNAIPSSLCAFTAILYDSLPPEQRAASTFVSSSGIPYGGALAAPKPVHVSNDVWNEALARNPDPNELAPVPLVGAGALHARIVKQQEKANALANHIKELKETLTSLEKASRGSKESIKYANSAQKALNRRLLEVMRKVEIVRCMGQSLQRSEVDAAGKLETISKNVNIIVKSLAEVEERGNQQARAWRTRATKLDSHGMSLHGEDTSLEEEDRMALFNVLNDQRLGMEQLSNIVNRDVRDANIIKDELSKAQSSSRGKPLKISGVGIFGGRR